MLFEFLLSLLRMFISYFISLFIAFTVGYIIAKDKLMEKIFMPIIDVLQSVPILTFFPVALYLIIHYIPIFGPEVAVIFLIVTSMVWNLIFSVYESLISLPNKFTDLISMFKFNAIDRFFKIYIPYTLPSLIPNSMVSWANGWYFLIATEIISIGDETYTLKGIGSYLMNAAKIGNYHNLFFGLLCVVIFIIGMNLFFWRPLLSVVNKIYKKEEDFNIYLLLIKHFNIEIPPLPNLIFSVYYHLVDLSKFFILRYVDDIEKLIVELIGGFKAILLVSLFISLILLIKVSADVSLVAIQYVGLVGKAFIFSFIRIFIALILSLLWVLPITYLLVKNKFLEQILMPVFEILAAIPVTALFPVILIIMLNVLPNMELFSIIFLMTGMQWYILFNVYAGFKNVDQSFYDLKHMFKIPHSIFFKKVLVPIILPILIVGIISAVGGGWNAVIVAEFVPIGNNFKSVLGIGSLMDEGLVTGNVGLLFLTSVSVGLFVPLLNIFLWRPLMKQAARYKVFQ